ncbi:MAG: glycoside hydrolase family 38 C-terminal domain-containing protein, partial [Candidatus Aminicenantales bacterium]
MGENILFLVCNAHLDPVWLWPWEEGVAEALTTFRTAARLCEEFPGFMFNHNEALLYKWVERHAPDLFRRIQNLVRTKKWHICGGWYLQPDCNMPSGESFVRQILVGKKYFLDRFRVEPRTAFNVDSFGHTRGLVQILKKSGYTSYLFCRPDSGWMSLPAEDFVWVGYDGSEILAHRAIEHYNSRRGQAAQRVRRWLTENAASETGLLLWGIGDHGGGPSRKDLKSLQKLLRTKMAQGVRHGTPEDFFERLEARKETLPRHAASLNSWAVGCYTSMARVKQAHRRLESAYFLTEKMVTHAALAARMDYPREELDDALEDLLFAQFHDILPGSAIARVEEEALWRMGHGQEILSRLRARAFFALASGEAPAEEGEFPILVYNPHPFPVHQTVECEFQPYEPSAQPGSLQVPDVRNAQGRKVPCQLEKESSTLSIEWRRKVVFDTRLEPARMNRFTCRLRRRSRGREGVREEKNWLVLKSGGAELVIRTTTGLVDSYRVRGRDYLRPRAFQALVLEDNPDSWGMSVRSFRDYEGKFSLMPESLCAWFAGSPSARLKPVRVVEDGPVRTVVEALFVYNRSFLCQRYHVPKRGTEFEVELRVFWNERDRMLKLAVPTVFRDGVCRGQVAYGVEEFLQTGMETVAQQWVGLVSADGRRGLTVINDRTYGFDVKGGELRISLLRSAAYAADTGGGRALRYQERFIPRMDQGEHVFRFWVNGGTGHTRMHHVDREASVRNQPPMALCCYPDGLGDKVPASVVLSDDAVQVTAIKMAEDNKEVVLRLFEPTGERRATHVSLPVLGVEFDIIL